MDDGKRVVEAGSGTPSLDHQAVNKMAQLMKHELDDNKQKKGGRVRWVHDTAKNHVLQTYYHAGKLQAAVIALEKLLKDEDASQAEIKYYKDRVKEFSADVANHAMMVADTLGLLELGGENGQKRETYNDCT